MILLDQKGRSRPCRSLSQAASIHNGFKVLLDNHQLDNTFEAFVVRFKSQFKPDIVFRLAEDFPLRKIIKFKSKLFVHSMVFHMGFAPGFALSSKPTVLKGPITSGLCYYILPSKQLYFTDINGLSSGGITQSIILLCFLNSLNG